jgi:hypothetical protein
MVLARRHKKNSRSACTLSHHYCLSGITRPRNRSASPGLSSTRLARVSSLPHSHSKVLRPSAYQSSSRPSRISRSPHPHPKTIRPEGSISEDRRMLNVPPVFVCNTRFARRNRAHNVNLAEVEGGYALGPIFLTCLKMKSRFMVLWQIRRFRRAA